MAEADAGVEAAKETTVFLSVLKICRITGKRGRWPIRWTKCCLMWAASLAGAETVADMARFGQAKLGFLQRFRLFVNGTPSHDQLGIILARLDQLVFQRCF